MAIPKSFTFWAIVVIAVLAFVIGLLTCNKGRSRPEIVLHPTVSEVDSMNEKEAKEKAYIDSLVYELAVAKKNKDSIAEMAKKKSDILHVKTLQVNALVKELELYKKYGDTDSYIEGCDSLLPQVSDLTETVELYRYDNARLLDSVQRVEDKFSLIIAQKDYLYSELRGSYDKISSNGLNLESVNSKLRKQANRKWVISVGAAYLFDGQRWRYGAGIQLGRRIARF